jgi:large subunit ribosomal protein L15
MQLHEIRPIHKFKKRKRVGRGGKRGTYSGRGMKGQKARAGRKLKPLIRELIKKYPKLRGVGFKVREFKTTILNIETLEKKFNAQEIVNPKTLLKKGVLHKIKGRIPKVKILGKGELTKKLIIEQCQISKSAKEKIEKAGGSIK